MKTLELILVIFVIISLSCSAQTNNKDNDATTTRSHKVEVYYFHYTRRCITCKTVENESKNAVKELYGDKVSFKGYNLEEPEGEKKADQLGVSGQTLLIVDGDMKINITNEGFMNARSNPDKLKKIIKEKIDPLL